MRGAADDWRDCPRPDTRLPRPPRLAAERARVGQEAFGEIARGDELRFEERLVAAPFGERLRRGLGHHQPHRSQGDDFRDGKVTLPVILAYARGSDADRRFWRQAMSGERAGDADHAHASGLLKSTEEIADTLGRARH